MAEEWNDQAEWNERAPSSRINEANFPLWFKYKALTVEQENEYYVLLVLKN